MPTTLVMQGPMVEELRRLADRALDDPHDPRRGMALRRAVEGREFAHDLPGSSPYRVVFEDLALELVRDQAPWIAARFHAVFGDVDPDAQTDHGLAERLRGHTIEDLIVHRSGTGRIGSVHVKIEGVGVLECVLPFGFHFRPRPPRLSEQVMEQAAAAEKR